MKLAVIGGGSSYTPELVDGLFAHLDRIPVSQVWLMDPCQERLSIVSGLSKRMAARHGQPFTVHATPDLEEAVDGARYVITQLRVGGIQARIQDEKLGLRHGIVGQETTGVGGFACALRTAPAILKIAKAMERLSPDGFLVNFTNPSGIIAEALFKYSSIRAAGLCNVPIGIIMKAVEYFGCKREEVALDYIGLNHLSWIRGATVAGRDVSEEMLERFIAEAAEEWKDAAIREGMVAAMRSLRMPCNGYLQYFYATAAVMKYLQAKEKTRGEEIIGIEQSLFDKYGQASLDEKPEELSQRGGAHYSTAAFLLIDAVENNTEDAQIVCCRNNGAIPTFDDDVSVEVPAIIGKDGATAIPQRAPEPAIRGLMQLVKAYETLTVKAAVEGDRNAAYQAMLMHPLMPGAAGSKALLDELLTINRDYVAAGLLA